MKTNRIRTAIISALLTVIWFSMSGNPMPMIKCGPPPDWSTSTSTAYAGPDVETIELNGTIIYAGHHAGGYAISVHDGTAPVPVEIADIPALQQNDYILDLARTGTTLWALASPFRLLSIDISDPATPALTTVTVSSYERASGLHVEGATAWITCGNWAGDFHLLIWDVGVTPFSPMGQVELGVGVARKVVVIGDTVWAVHHEGLTTVDASNPYDPQIRTFIPLAGGLADVLINGTTAYISAGEGYLYVLDAANPEYPTVTHESMVGEPLRSIVLDGTTIWAAAEGAGVLCVDISDPDNAGIRSRINTAGFTMDLAVSGTTIFVGDGMEGVIKLFMEDFVAE